MRLCYNSLLVVLNKTCSQYIGTRDLNDTLIKIVDDTFSRVTTDPDSSRSSFAQELLSAKIDIKGDLKKKAKELGVKGLIPRVQTIGKPLTELPNRDMVIKLLNQLIIKSTNLSENDIVFSSPEIKKMDFFKVSLSMDVYLANLIYYIFTNAIKVNKVAKTDFSSQHPLTDEDYKELVDGVKEIESPYFDVEPLLTIENIEDFGSVFTELTITNKLSNSKPSDLKVFYLDCDSDGLNYNNLKDFIALNLGNYIYSRNDIKGFEDKHKVTMIGVEALKSVKEHGGLTGNELGNILLYSFLECILKAPKLFSNYEIDSYHLSKSNAIHIQSIKNGDSKYTQLIFGVSNINGTFKDALIDGLDLLKKVKGKEENKYTFINSSIFRESFDYATAAKLKEIILPTESRKSYIQSGYSLFIGYKVNIKATDYSTPEEYSVALQNKMREDINDCFSTIEQTVKEATLDTRSLYIYVLPFNDPSNDKESIIEAITTI